MPWLSVHVVNQESEAPCSGERVKIVIHHGGLMPDTSLEDYTDDDGIASFDFDGGSSVDIYAAGKVLESGVDDEVKVYV